MWVEINVHLEVMSASTESVNQAANASSVNFIATGTHPEHGRWIGGRTRNLACGLQPRYAAVSSDWFSLLEQYLGSHPGSAMGEVGLDFRPQMPEREIQQRVFENQLALASVA